MPHSHSLISTGASFSFPPVPENVRNMSPILSDLTQPYKILLIPKTVEKLNLSSSYFSFCISGRARVLSFFWMVCYSLFKWTELPTFQAVSCERVFYEVVVLFLMLMTFKRVNGVLSVHYNIVLLYYEVACVICNVTRSQSDIARVYCNMYA